MAYLFNEDGILWTGSEETFDHKKISSWSFSNNRFHIDQDTYDLGTEGYDLTVFELALFDLHFTYWKSILPPGGTQNFNYHLQLRFLAEDQIKKGKGRISNPPILIPWMWRTFCLCNHDLSGRGKFDNLSQRHRRINWKTSPTFHGQ
jgi:hypothetical protein